MAKRKSERDHIEEAREKLLAAILPHVEFDGWSRAAFDRAISETGLAPDLASGAAPRGAVDLAVAFHRAGDQAMVTALKGVEFEALPVRQKIAYAVRWRLEHVAPYREQVRLAMSYFSLPLRLQEGGNLVWETADHIWNAAGDTAEDANYYTKRAILSGVFSSTLLYWLNDTSQGSEDSWAFLDRRIENVMQFEKVKSVLLKSPFGPAFESLMSAIKKPDENYKHRYPGYRG
ncbi:MAG: COQ9 family protein [Pseudomonadota bacterium]